MQTDAKGVAPLRLEVRAKDGDVIAATATDAAGNTSAMSDGKDENARRAT